MPRAHAICSEKDLPCGSRRIVEINGRSIGIFNVGGTLRALRNVCPHRGAPLCLGSVGGTLLPSRPDEFLYGKHDQVLRCPWHGYEFDMETGTALYDPADMRVKVYRAYVENGIVFLEM